MLIKSGKKSPYRYVYNSRGRPGDMVSIADIGFGVSQALPVLVALLAPADYQRLLNGKRLQILG